MLYRKGKVWHSTGQAGAQNKYSARTIQFGELRFPSALEARRFEELSLQYSAGLIDHLILHPHFDFVVNGVQIGRGYTADFEYIDENGRRVVEDVKGRLTRDWPKVRDLMLACHSISVSLWPPRERKRKLRTARQK